MSTVKRFYVDTEFTNLVDTSPISLAMVTDAGGELYVEVPYPDHECTPFVREIVIPQLGKHPGAWCSREDLPERLLRWLNAVRTDHDTVLVLYDHHADYDLLHNVLSALGALGPVPHWLHHRLQRFVVNREKWEAFLSGRGWTPHHALNDARALQYLFRDAE